ncbi:hypothetical protein [Actinoplanes aureus]|uniref:Uncharacterized protein n=1 Tax=Actinoplanes aureus TaxID=2792083 RepID=A0A931G0D8_9ACTN|nr:hypothetical protein [Actinoplanes aureus]MBG0566668.1 hypothetical protein [Actinoplanes aureus]
MTDPVGRRDAMPVLRPWLDARDPWRFVDNDPESDPTVFVPYLAHLETPGGQIHEPTRWAIVGARTVFIQSIRVTSGVTPIGQPPGGFPGGDVPLAGVESGRVDIRPVPADWHQLRARYPWAYEEWCAHEAREMYQWAEDGMSVEDIAARLARPPEHITAKLARVRALVDAAGWAPPRVEYTPYDRYAPSQFTEPVDPGIEQADPPPRLWYDEDPEVDPTAHLRFVLHLRRRGEQTETAEPAYEVQLRKDAIWYHRVRDGRHPRPRLTEVAAGWVEIRPVPADQERLRATYPAAYGPWRADQALLVLRAGRGRGGLTDNLRIAELGRPPDHVAAKYARLEELARAARTPGPRAEPAPHHRYPNRIEGQYIVSVLDVAIPREVAARAGATDVVLLNGCFGCTLTDEQVEALRADPDVDYISDDAVIDLR